jgi:hypothetical protein
LQSNNDDFSELDAETRQFDTSDVPYVTPAKRGEACSALQGTASSFNCPARPQSTGHLNFDAMNKVVQSRFQVASSEVIAKLIRAGYLKHARRHDADAITKAIAQMKQDLRGRGTDDDGPNAA